MSKDHLDSFDNGGYDDDVELSYRKEPNGVRYDNSSARHAPQTEEIKSFGGMMKAWPKITFCIVGNEFCERFSFYGMRAVLTLYLINILKFNDNTATIFFHGFVVLAYTSPLIGSALADGFFGKFWTIFSVSIVYTAGQIVLAVASTFKSASSIHVGLDMAGLFIIAMGTGGIKPCVAAFGGDQFDPIQLKMISLYFSIFYFSINAGSTLSIFLTPVLRSVPCLDLDSCYPLAFGVPAALMVLATVIFMLGSFWYKKYPPKENIVFEVMKTIKTAISNKITFDKHRNHWLDHYLDNHSCEADVKCLTLRRETGKKNQCQKRQFVEDVKSLLRVIVMYLPVPFFWALYDQQGSRWVIQAVAMDSRLWKGYSLYPDQMGIFNAILIMIFIPIFQIIIYPGLEKCGIRTLYLRRMAAGGILAAISFVICALVQFRVNQTLPIIPADNEAIVSMVNAFPSDCTLTFTEVRTDGGDPWKKTLEANKALIDDRFSGVHELFHQSDVDTIKGNKNFTITYTGCVGSSIPSTVSLPLKGGKSYYFVFGTQGYIQDEGQWDKPTEGQGQFSMNMNFMVPCSVVPSNVNSTWSGCSANPTGYYHGPLALCRNVPDSETVKCDPRDGASFYAWQMNYGDDNDNDWSPAQQSSNDNTVYVYNFTDVRPGTWDLYYMSATPKDPRYKTLFAKDIADLIVPTSVRIVMDGQGGVYSVTVAPLPNMTLGYTLYTIVPENAVSILWQIPQYVVITAGEILFSITGLEFSYSEAAPSMKSVVQAIWLLTVAFGDLIIIIITVINPFTDLAIEMMSYAGAMLVVIGIFILLAQFYYKYKSVDNGDNNLYDDDDDDKM